MSAKLGRPTDDPKNIRLELRLSDKDAEKLNFCSQKWKVSKAEVIRVGIDKVYQEEKSKSSGD